MGLTRRAFLGRLGLGAAVATLTTQQVIDAIAQKALAAPAAQPELPATTTRPYVPSDWESPMLSDSDDAKGSVFSKEALVLQWAEPISEPKRYIIGVTFRFSDGSSVRYKPPTPIDWPVGMLKILLDEIVPLEAPHNPVMMKIAYVTEQHNTVLGPDGRRLPVYSSWGFNEPLSPLTKTELEQFAHAIVVEAQSIPECIAMAEQTAVPRQEYQYANEGWVEYVDSWGPGFKMLETRPKMTLLGPSRGG